MNPTATRAGMPTARAIVAYALANWTQKPLLRSRNAAIASDVVAGIDGRVVDEAAVAEVVAQRLGLRVRGGVRLGDALRLVDDELREAARELGVAPQRRRDRSCRRGLLYGGDGAGRRRRHDRVVHAGHPGLTGHERRRGADHQRVLAVDTNRAVRGGHPALVEWADAVLLRERTVRRTLVESLRDRVVTLGRQRPLPAAGGAVLVERGEPPVVGPGRLHREQVLGLGAVELRADVDERRDRRAVARALAGADVAQVDERRGAGPRQRGRDDRTEGDRARSR